MDGEAFTGELIDDGQHPKRFAVMGAVLHEVIGPDVVLAGWPQPDARTIVQPQPTSLWLLPGNL